MKKDTSQLRIIKTSRILSGLFVVFFLGFFFTQTVHAATGQLYLKPSATTFASQSEFSVDVFVDSQSPVNALDAQISYEPNQIKFLGFTSMHSVVAFWQTTNPLLSNGHLRLSGGMIPAFSGTGGYVGTIHFKALAVGQSKMTFEQNSLYLADGKGTSVDVTSQPIVVTVDNNAALIKPYPVSTDDETVTLVSDVTPPTLILRIVSDSVSGKNLIVYNTDDPESGVRIVEMRSDFWGTWGPWEEIKNPAIYPDGALKVDVRSINNNGEITVQTISALDGYIKIIVIIPIIFVTFVFLVVYNKRRRMPKI